MAVAVFMHPREYGNAADSSKILLHALPGSRLFVFGVHEDEAALAEMLRGHTAAAVLYPGPDAVPPAALPPRLS
jgi:hypothetical protein